ncbi:MAG: radical SAM protein [Spirochaetales bacterium]|nr:radical SAM protein [Spirochaetales bacterium]
MPVPWIPAKTILSSWKPQPRWFGTEYNMNLYRGCSHGCIYCDSRSECYGVDDFDRIRPKERALEILEDELGRRRRKGVAAMGAMSDPYNPLEASLELTRGALELINRARFGAAVATKSSLVARDADILEEISRHSPVLVKVTVTTVDPALAAKIEPHAPSPAERLEAVRELRSRGIFTGILLMPVLPWITDSDEGVRSLVRAASGVNASFIYGAFGVTLRDRQREWYYSSLDRDFPGLSDRYRTLFGESYGCARRDRAAALEWVFRRECGDRNILWRMEDLITA